jgi:hypothetical protein
MCNTSSTYALTDLRAGNQFVKFPLCKSCQKATLSAHIVPGPILKEGAAALSQAWIKALHRQLIAAGHTAEVYSAEKVATNAHEGAVDWPTGDAVVTFVVPPVNEP